MIDEYQWVVDKTHTDELGHLNHVSAIKVMEYVRDEWYEKSGLWGGRPWSENETLGTIVVNINVNYRLECFLGEELIVKTFPLSKGTKSYVIGQEIIKSDGQIAISGESTNVIMDLAKHEVLVVPESIAIQMPN